MLNETIDVQGIRARQRAFIPCGDPAHEQLVIFDLPASLAALAAVAGELEQFGRIDQGDE